MLEQDKKINLKYASLIFVTTILVYFIFSMIVSVALSGTLKEGEEISKYSSYPWYAILSYGAFPLSFLITLFAFNYKDKTTLTFTFKNAGFKLKYLPLIIFLSFCILFGLSGINGYFIDFLSDNFGYVANDITIPKKSFWGITTAVVFIAILPSVCEELLFRKIILSSMDDSPDWFTVLTVGLLFALFHFNPAQTPYQFIFGCIFVLVVKVTGSVYSTVIMHFINNLSILVIHYVGWSVTLPIWATILAALGVACCVGALIYILIKNKKEKQALLQNGLFIFVPIFLCFLIWLGGFA